MEQKKKPSKFNNDMIGTDNYKVPDCPFHVPKQNMSFFKTMQQAVSSNTHMNYDGTYPPKDQNLRW